jgi:CheY-like chemotaxis protein
MSTASGNVIVTVQDDGTGIPSEALPKLFDPFFTTKRPGGGTGLGLSICLSIVREHGGTIQAESLPGGGSAFKVYLPIARDLPRGASPSRSADSSDSGSDHALRPTPTVLKGIRVLVLDDEESIRSLLEEGLSAHGLDVFCASTAEEAAALVAARPCDALLCDLRLKNAGAFSEGQAAAAHVIAAAGTQKPIVIFMTGEYVDQDSKLGGATLLQKPFRILDVLAVMKEAFVFAKQGSEK